MISNILMTMAAVFGLLCAFLALKLKSTQKELIELKNAVTPQRSDSDPAAQANTACTKAPEPMLEEKPAPVNNSQGLFATLSHELRTPLNGVLGMAQLMKQDHQDERIDTLEGCAYHMQSVLHALVNFSKIQSNWGNLPEYREWVSIHDLLEQMKKELLPRARSRGLSINLTHADKKLRLRVDRDHLESIVQGALLGSLECVPLNPAKEQCRELKVRWESAEKGIKIIIENPLERPTINRGAKIKAVSEMVTSEGDDRTRMEYLYWAVTTSLLEHYHGGMIATAIDGGGVRTTLGIELEKMEASASKERPIGGIRLEAPVKGPETWVKLPFMQRILVVEDDPVNRLLMTELLKRLGQQYVLANNGQEALEVFAENDNFDVILMDIDMPILNGVSATQALRMGEAGDRGMNVPIVAVTAFNSLSDESKFRKAGMNYFIPKPIGAQDLRMVLLDIRQKAEVVCA